MENNSIQTSDITELFSLKHGIEIKDAEELGYGDALTTDKEIDPEIVKMVTAED